MPWEGLAKPVVRHAGEAARLFRGRGELRPRPAAAAEEEA